MDSIVIPILLCCLLLSSLGVIFFKKPVHACLSFLFSLLTLACVYLTLFAEFIAIMQVLVYAGAILVIFMFVIILFQDAHEQIEKFAPKNNRLFLLSAALSLIAIVSCLGYLLSHSLPNWSSTSPLQGGYGSVQLLGQSLYLDFFFPFEVVVLLFLIAIVGTIYTAKKV